MYHYLNFNFIILIIVIIFLYYFFILNNNKETLRKEIEEGFENSAKISSKSNYDSQFSPLGLLGSKNLINDQNLLKRKLLKWEYLFNGHNPGYIEFGPTPFAPIYSYPTLNFHSPNGPTKIL